MYLHFTPSSNIWAEDKMLVAGWKRASWPSYSMGSRRFLDRSLRQICWKCHHGFLQSTHDCCVYSVRHWFASNASMHAHARMHACAHTHLGIADDSITDPITAVGRWNPITGPSDTIADNDALAYNYSRLPPVSVPCDAAILPVCKSVINAWFVCNPLK